ncbi:MAG TPA: hypothetical protein ENH28_03795 [Euryarchaeota archaeon]|nr:hypothetical protein [Euryarchaeota archaeon]
MSSSIRVIIVVLLILPLAVNAANLTLSWETGLVVPASHDTKVLHYAEAQTGSFGTELLLGADSSFYLFSGGSQPSLYIPFRMLNYMDTIDYSASGKLNDIVSASTSRVEVHELSEAYTLLWNTSLNNIKAIKTGDVDLDGFDDNLLVATSSKLYAFKPKDNKTLFDFDIETGAKVLGVANFSGGSFSNILIGYSKDGKGKVVVYNYRGRVLWSYDFPKPVDYILTFDDSKGVADRVAVKYGDGTANDDFIVFNSSGSILWRSYDVVSISKCDFDGDGIKDDILAVGSRIYAMSGDGNVIASYTKDELGATVMPVNLKGAICVVAGSDGIANDVDLIGYVSQQGYYIYGVSNIASEKIKIKTENKPPVAIAGKDITVKEGEEVVLSGLKSYDEDGEIVAYTWVEGDKILSYNPAFSIKLKPGVHVIILKIRDNRGATAMDSVTVTVLPSQKKEENLKPVAKAGENLNLTLGEIANLSASQSYDPDGKIISYQWSLDGRIISAEENFSYKFPLGEHLLKLRVIDNRSAQAEDYIKVVVNPLPEKIKKEIPVRSISATAFAFILTLIVFLRRRYIG